MGEKRVSWKEVILTKSKKRPTISFKNWMLYGLCLVERQVKIGSCEHEYFKGFYKPKVKECN